ncbi:MAG: radical SAM protein [Bacteroidetes bacterium]|nr:radical SAM protein [Bacteroidota bacterium]
MTELYQPYRIDIVLDNECNLSCIGCIRTKNEKEKTIDYPNFVKSIIENKSEKEYQIHFTGGEPFLDFSLLTQTIKEIQSITSNRLNYSIYTNLTILNKDIIEFVKSNNIQIHTSLDGLKEENDTIRGNGTFEIITNNIKRLKRAGIEINSVTTTLKNKNINNISTKFITELENLKVKTWRLNIDYLGIEIEPNDLIDKIFTLYNFAIQHHISVEGTWLYPFHNLISDNKNGFCPATKGETISILPDGKISMCPYSDTFFGTYKTDWHDINKEFNVVKKNLSENKKCTTCIIKDYCQTQCLITREQNNPELFDWYCKVYRGLTIKLLNYHIQN